MAQQSLWSKDYILRNTKPLTNLEVFVYLHISQLLYCSKFYHGKSIRLM